MRHAQLRDDLVKILWEEMGEEGRRRALARLYASVDWQGMEVNEADEEEASFLAELIFGDLAI